MSQSLNFLSFLFLVTTIYLLLELKEVVPRLSLVVPVQTYMIVVGAVSLCDMVVFLTLALNCPCISYQMV